MEFTYEKEGGQLLVEGALAALAYIGDIPNHDRPVLKKEIHQGLLMKLEK